MPSHKGYAQREKARRIASYLFSHLSPELRRDHMLPDLVAAMAAEDRLKTTKAAGAHAKTRPVHLPPSDTSWALVVEEIRFFVRMCTLEAA